MSSRRPVAAGLIILAGLAGWLVVLAWLLSRVAWPGI